MLPPTGVPITIDDPTSNVQLGQLSTNVHDGVEKLVSALDARALWLLNSNQLNAALNDANAMISIAPWSPLGYLHAGNIHVTEKRYESAVAVYDEGLRHVATNDPRYRELIRARAIANNSINRCIDFVSKLPLDVVVCNIVPRLIQGQTSIRIGEQHAYLNVCRTWRKRIAMAEDLTFTVGPTPLTPRGTHQLLDMAPAIKSLVVMQQLRDVVTTLTEGFRFHSLKKLSLHVTSIRLANEVLLSLLSLNRALTHLHVGTAMGRSAKYRLCDIMNVCPNLMAISFPLWDMDMDGASLVYPSIIKLTTNLYMAKDTLSPILRHFPNLKYLRLGYVSNSAMLSVIQQYCPLLQQLFVSAQYVYDDDDDAIIRDHQEKGLRLLHLCGDKRYQLCVQPRSEIEKRRQVFSENDLVRLIMQHAETLETITMESKYALEAPSMILRSTTTRQVTFKRLREIRYPFNSRKNLLSFLIWIIRNAPHLESIKTVYGTWQACVMRELLRPRRQHRHLKRIGLRADDTDQVNEEQFIQHHIQLDQQSSLKEITLTLDLEQLSSSSWLHLIPRLTRLTHLEIRCDDSHVLDHVVSPFIAEVASKCLALERFTLSSPTLPIAYDDVIGICSHSNLKALVIDAEKLDGDAHLFVRDCQHIQSLHLKLDTFNKEDIDTLRMGSFKLLCTQRR